MSKCVFADKDTIIVRFEHDIETDQGIEILLKVAAYVHRDGTVEIFKVEAEGAALDAELKEEAQRLAGEYEQGLIDDAGDREYMRRAWK